MLKSGGYQSKVRRKVIIRGNKRQFPTIHDLLERQHGRLQQARHDVVLFGGGEVHLDGILLVLQLCQLLCLGDPVDITLQILLHLLLSSQSLEVPTRLGLLLLLGELSD